MTATQQTAQIVGGLDQESPANLVPPGRCIACLNHEMVSRGCQRTQGFERYDGRLAPSAAGDAGTMAARRAAIQKPAGTGPARGVVWYGGFLYTVRDNGGNATLYRATNAGWVAVPMGYSFQFANGGPIEIFAGDVLTGETSGATATVHAVALDSTTDWSDGNATGVIVVMNYTGAFVEGEDISTATADLVATVASPLEPITLPTGGRYDFVVHNFYGSTGTERAYGVNGVGRAFEFDGGTTIPIYTGMEDDRPFLIAAHKKHLFLGFPKGSLQFSSQGEPRSWVPLTGAAEIGLGKELTNLIPSTDDVLLITTASSISTLTGNDSADFNLSPLSDEAGARPWTAKKIGSVIYMDERGIRSASAAQAYGNFKLGTYTSLIQTTLDAKREAGVFPVDSAVVKTKDQYLLFFNDGSGLSIYFGRKNPEAMLFQYPFVVTSHFVADVAGQERVFVGGSDGHVYELNKGTSFDGAVINAFVSFPFWNQGLFRFIKRYFRTFIQGILSPGTQLSVAADFNYNDGYQPYDDSALFGLTQGAYQQSLRTTTGEIDTPGAGENMSVTVMSSSDAVPSYILQSYTVSFSKRGLKR